jgi:hypothetical protein
VPNAVPLTPGVESRPAGAELRLFDRAGCPACWQVAEVGDAYLDSVARADYRDADVWNSLVAARGMCPAHTRRLAVQQPVTASLTAGYSEVVRAAMSEVASKPAN